MQAYENRQQKEVKESTRLLSVKFQRKHKNHTRKKKLKYP